MYQIDVNCDMGERFEAYIQGNDEAILDYVTSANIACGFHSGDPSIMRKLVEQCLVKGTAIGAHPGLPDLPGFGRRVMNISKQEAYDIVLYQLGALDVFVKAQGGRMNHVKPHGALYNMAARDAAMAEGIAEAVYDINPQLILYAMSGSELIQAGRLLGLQTASEVFADRTYQQNGSLTAREEKGAFLHEPDRAAEQVLLMVKTGMANTVQGSLIAVKAETVCVHGDSPNVLALLKRLRESLSDHQIVVQSLKFFNNK